VGYTYERPDLKALAELEELFRHLGTEVAAWRRRSLKAEAELQEIRARGGVYEGPELSGARQRIIELETENQVLRERIDAAKERVRALAARLAFLEQGGTPT
jgi:predicted  nucleic acid-binding Zn-ribbon protein